jgi:hypothetical protein
VLVVEMNLSPSKMPESSSPESDGMSRIALLVSIQFRISQLWFLPAFVLVDCAVLSLWHCVLMFPYKLVRSYVHYYIHSSSLLICTKENFLALLGFTNSDIIDIH